MPKHLDILKLQRTLPVQSLKCYQEYNSRDLVNIFLQTDLIYYVLWNRNPRRLVAHQLKVMVLILKYILHR